MDARAQDSGALAMDDGDDLQAIDHCAVQEEVHSHQGFLQVTAAHIALGFHRPGGDLDAAAGVFLLFRL